MKNLSLTLNNVTARITQGCSVWVPVMLVMTLGACGTEQQTPAEEAPHALFPPDTIGTVDGIDRAFYDLVPPYAVIEVLAEGFNWAEGPLWVPGADYLLFSDVPENVVYRWDSGTGLTPWLTPSGNTGYATGAREGANGLLLDRYGRLVLCQHGDRRVARMDAPLEQPEPRFVTLADRDGTSRLNSPNDGVFHSSGDLYFTDPPYGLADSLNSETGYQGVYRLTPDGEVRLLTTELSRPNGIGLSPDERTLYVANSDPRRAIWMAYDIEEDGSISNGRVFFDATAWVQTRPGLPDGLKVDANGNVFATGPGGVLVFTPDGKHLGTIQLPVAAANCAFGGDGSSLFITADMYLLRVKTTTRGRVFSSGN